MNSAPLSTRNAEQVDMFAARIDAIIRPSAPGNSSWRQAKPKASSGSASGVCPCATIAATTSPTSAQPTVQTRFT